MAAPSSRPPGHWRWVLPLWGALFLTLLCGLKATGLTSPLVILPSFWWPLPSSPVIEWQLGRWFREGDVACKEHLERKKTGILQPGKRT